MYITSFLPKSGRKKTLGSINVLVGPNNAGKTQTLRDIHQCMTTSNARATVVEDLDYEGTDNLEDILSPLNIKDDPDRADRRIVRDFGSNLQSGGQVKFNPDSFESLMERENIGDILNKVGQFHVFYLDASSRLEIAESGASHNAQEDAPTTLLQKLYEADFSLEEELRSAFKEKYTSSSVFPATYVVRTAK